MALAAALILMWHCAMPVQAAVREVIVVFKTHFDIGYTDMASNVVQRYRTTMIDQALAVCDQNRDLPADQQFVWTLPGWPMHKILEDWPGQTRERQQRILEAVREGRFAIHALPFTTHTELLELEDLVRGMGYASDIARAAGIPRARDAKMTDVPSHSWILPTLLRRAGVDFLHLGCNAASSSPQVPPLFWWEGPDGSRLLTMYTAESYGTGLIPPAQWPHATWLALIHTGDNHGPPQPAEVKKLLAEAAEKLPGVKVRIGRLQDFADALLAEKPRLPVVHGDMPDTWIHGPMSDPAGASLARQTRPLLMTAGLLSAHLPFWHAATPGASSALSNAWENSLLYGEHTWGGALYWVADYQKTDFPYGETWKTQRAQGRFQRSEASWEEHTDYIRTAARLGQPVLTQALGELARDVRAEGRRIVVFNPLPWKRDGIVTVPSSWTDIKALHPVGGGDNIAVASNGTALSFIARDVPPMGYLTYIPARAVTAPLTLLTNRPDVGILENRFFRIALDAAHGGILSFVDKRTARDWVDPKSPWRLGQYLGERFDRDQVAAYVKAYVKIDAAWATNELGKPNMPPASEAPYQALTHTNLALRFEQTPISVSAILTAPAQGPLPALEARLTLHENMPFADWSITLKDKPADPWPEAGWICLPFKVSEPTFHLGRLGSVVDPTEDLVPGANHDLFGVNTGVAVLDNEGLGVGVCPLDHPLVSLDEPGCWKYRRTFVPHRPHVFINVHNNQWTTNFRLWNEGTWTSRVRLWTIHGVDNDPTLITPSLEARMPVCAAAVDAPAGTLPAKASGLSLSRRGVMLSALELQPDGRTLLLRMWELAGQSGPCVVRLPEGCQAAHAQPVDLRGQSLGQPIAIRNHTFKMELEPFAPASFLLNNP